MNNALAVQTREFSNDQIELIRESIAPTATPQEFELFIYRCKHMDLDPLKPGEIYFIKYGNSPGTIVVGIEGFRKRAERTGKRSGIKRGSIRNAEGKLIGAWCEVFRSDWKEPAREEVSLSEYNTGKAQWAKMPETMIKKVAECAALRMAFPDELGGLYGEEEMHQAQPQSEREVIPASLISEPSPSVISIDELNALGEYKVPANYARIGGQKLKDLGLPDIQHSVDYWMNRGKNSAQGALTGAPAEFVEKGSRYCELKKALSRKAPSAFNDDDLTPAEQEHVERMVNDNRMASRGTVFTYNETEYRNRE